MTRSSPARATCRSALARISCNRASAACACSCARSRSEKFPASCSALAAVALASVASSTVERISTSCSAACASTYEARTSVASVMTASATRARVATNSRSATRRLSGRCSASMNGKTKLASCTGRPPPRAANASPEKTGFAISPAWTRSACAIPKSSNVACSRLLRSRATCIAESADTSPRRTRRTKSSASESSVRPCSHSTRIATRCRVTSCTWARPPRDGTVAQPESPSTALTISGRPANDVHRRGSEGEASDMVRVYCETLCGRSCVRGATSQARWHGGAGII